MTGSLRSSEECSDCRSEGRRAAAGCGIPWNLRGIGAVSLACNRCINCIIRATWKLCASVPVLGPTIPPSGIRRKASLGAGRLRLAAERADAVAQHQELLEQRDALALASEFREQLPQAAAARHVESERFGEVL